MAHPFEKLFENALRKSTLFENEVTIAAEKLIEKGYRSDEVCTVLLKLEKSLIDDDEVAIVRDAHEEVCEEDDE